MSLTFTPEAVRRFLSRQRVEDSRVVYLSTRLELQEQLADAWRREKGYVGTWGASGIGTFAEMLNAQARVYEGVAEEGENHDGQ